MDMLSLRTERLPARYEEVDIGSISKNLFCQYCGRLHVRFATVQYQQHPTPFKEGSDARSCPGRLHWYAQRRRKAACEEVGIRNITDIEEAGIAIELVRKIMRKSEGYARFTYAAWAYYRYESVFEKLLAKCSEDLVATYQPMWTRWQRTSRGRSHFGGRIIERMRNWRNKTIALAGNI